MKQHMVRQVLKSSVIITLFTIMTVTSITAQDIQQLPLGSILPLGDVQMEGVSGRNLTLDGVKGEKGLLVIFSCNTCPWVVKLSLIHI